MTVSIPGDSRGDACEWAGHSKDAVLLAVSHAAVGFFVIQCCLGVILILASNTNKLTSSPSWTQEGFLGLLGILSAMNSLFRSFQEKLNKTVLIRNHPRAFARTKASGKLQRMILAKKNESQRI